MRVIINDLAGQPKVLEISTMTKTHYSWSYCDAHHPKFNRYVEGMERSDHRHPCVIIYDIADAGVSWICPWEEIKDNYQAIAEELFEDGYVDLRQYTFVSTQNIEM